MLCLLDKPTDRRCSIKQAVVAMAMKMDKRTFAHSATFIKYKGNLLRQLPDSSRFGGSNNYGKKISVLPASASPDAKSLELKSRVVKRVVKKALPSCC